MMANDSSSAVGEIAKHHIVLGARDFAYAIAVADTADRPPQIFFVQKISHDHPMAVADR